MITHTVNGARARVVTWLVIGVVVAVSFIDAGSIVLTRMRVDDDLKSAGFAGATAIQGQKVSGQAAQAAYAAATRDLNEGEEVDPKTFAVRPDGGVTLTVRMTAPTLMFKHLGFLDDFVNVEDTYDQPRIGY
ncbi:hypothetical protein [Nocardioides rubriscoriae]|uniref:hypothetical protein n=1 Tax=Nocardioides rubriscoriae TaxID=642762 RepID=UPI0011E04F31|nr:hypothetical protein [Nocardioides rubriscoriae]